MNRSLRLRTALSILLPALSYCLFVGYGVLHSTGWVGATMKNGDGCVCHGNQPVDSVHVWLEGPDALLPGGVAPYTLFMQGGPAVAGGFNVAAGAGTLSPVDSTVQVISGELTHTAPKLFEGGIVSWQFTYQAPINLTSDTIYSVGNSVDLNGTPTNDQYNFGANFIVSVTDTATGVAYEAGPQGFSLSQNYPNPFNPVTRIRYSVGTRQRVSLSVYNAEGKQVKLLVEGVQAPGLHEIAIDAAGWPSGIYFCMLSSGSYSGSRKMLLIR